MIISQNFWKSYPNIGLPVVLRVLFLVRKLRGMLNFANVRHFQLFSTIFLWGDVRGIEEAR